MDKKIKRMIWCSFVCAVIVCVVEFVGLMTFMRNKTKSTIDDVSQIYMSEINTQLQEKFTSIISLRIEQVKGIIERTQVDTFHYTDKMYILPFL